MKKNKTGIIIRIICLTLTALVLLALLLWGLRFSFGDWFSGSGFSLGVTGHTYENSGSYQVGSGSVPAQAITELEINWVAGAVDIQVTEGDEIVFQESDDGLSQDEQLRYLVSGNRLILQYRKSEWSFGWFSRTPEKRLTVQIPQSILEQLNQVEVNATSARISAQDLRAREMEIDNVSGQVELQDCQFQILDLETVSGDLRISGQVEYLDAEGVSADLDATLTTTPREISFESVSGTVRLVLPADAAFAAALDSVSGRMNCTFPTTLRGDTYYCGQGGGDFRFDTVSGNVDIRPAE